MQEVAGSEARYSRFNEIDHDVRLKEVLDCLENENSQLKKLVVRLSETIIRNVMDKR